MSVRTMPVVRAFSAGIPLLLTLMGWAWFARHQYKTRGVNDGFAGAHHNSILRGKHVVRIHAHTCRTCMHALHTLPEATKHARIHAHNSNPVGQNSGFRPDNCGPCGPLQYRQPIQSGRLHLCVRVANSILELGLSMSSNLIRIIPHLPVATTKHRVS